MTRLQRQIIVTLAYSAQFDFPLTSSELWIRLLAPSGGWRRSDYFSYLSMIGSLWILERVGAVRRNGQYWELPGTLARRAIRERRTAIAHQKIRALQPLITVCSMLPCVWGVAITGSAALKNTESEHDVDLLIVPQPQSMWLLRPALIFLALLAGKRRSWNHEEPDSWCFNLWLEPTALAMKYRDQTRYLGYECLQAQWVLVRGSVKKDYFEANKWLAKMAPNFWQSAVRSMPQAGLPLWDWTLPFRLVVLILNWVAYVLQRSYMQPHRTRERVEISAAYFHPRDTRRVIGSGWKQVVVDWRSEMARSVEDHHRPVVLVTGVFDLLHREHVRFLKNAARRGRLVVGVESDERVRSIKGAGRPINTAAVRVAEIKKLAIAERIVVLPAQFSRPSDHRSLLRSVRPNILAVSSHTKHLPEKARLMQEIDGTVEIVHEHNPAVSTTLMLKRRSQRKP